MSNSMTPERAIEILNPEHREHYDSIETVNEACRMGMVAINFLKNNKNNDIVLLSNMLGHSDINTTAIYLQRTEQEQIRELNKTVNW